MDSKGIGRILIAMAITPPINKISGAEIKIIVRTFKDLFHKVSVLIIITLKTKTGIIGNILGGIKILILESFDSTLEEDVTDTYNIIPSVTKYDKNGFYHVLLRNDSDYHMTFPTNMHIAEMQRVSR